MDMEFKNATTAILTNPKDDLDARVVLIAQSKDKSMNYYSLQYRFESTHERYYSIDVISSAKDQKIEVLNRSVVMNAIEPTPNGLKHEVDLYKSPNPESPEDYMHHSVDMRKGFFTSNIYKNSSWHMSYQQRQLMNKKHALQDKLEQVDEQIKAEHLAISND